MIIEKIKARKILNSAGNWTIECILTADNQIITASVPSGISKGKYERAPVTVEEGINQIEKEIFDKIKNKDLNQSSLDEILSQGNWGSNATLAVSAAFFKLDNFNTAYNHYPKLMMLMFEGKKHGNKKLKVQEFMLIFNQIEEGVKIYHQIKKALDDKKLMTTVGAEGGFSPNNLNESQILKLLSKYNKPIALDVAGNTNPLTFSELIKFSRNYPIVSLEDPFSEEETEKWHNLYQKINQDILIVGDDLTVTDSEKIKSASQDKLINAVIIKPNQQGTMTAAAEALKTGQKLGLKTIVSHRGESTNDTWAADFALKYKADYVKFGAPARGERIAKYNRLL